MSERDIHHHADIARGGTGFVIVGATTPDMKTGRPTVTCLVADGDNYVPGLARLAESMHRYGAKCAVQLQHPGRQCAIPRYNTLGATDRVLKLPWSAGHEIVYENAEEKGKEIREASIAEILELVDLFSEAAWRVKQAGFDAVELHAAHGYLLSEFMSPYLNMRTDRFGGSFENRMRFPLAVIDSIQKKCGKGFPILVRYSFEEWCAGGRDLEEGIETARVLERAGCAALDLSQGMQESPGAGFDPMQYPQGWATYAAEAVKKVVKIPVITSHSLRDPEYCEQILAEGKTDLVGLARQLLADPYWPVKAQYGKVKSIRKCISCLGGCWQESLMAKQEIACSINAACGSPAYDDMKRTDKPVQRGGRRRRTGRHGGGPDRDRARPPRDAVREARRAGRGDALRLPGPGQGEDALVPGLDPGPAARPQRRHPAQPRADGGRAARLRPRAQRDRRRLVRARRWPATRRASCRSRRRWPAPRSPASATRAAGRCASSAQRVLLWGDSYAATDTAAWLADIGKQVTIVTENREFAADCEVIHMYVLRKRFAQGDAEVLHSRPYKHPVTVITSTTVAEIREGAVVLQDKDFNRTTLEVDDVVTCHTRPEIALFAELRAAGVHVLNVGDSVAPRNLYHAVKEGSAFGLAVDEHLLFNPNGAILDDLPMDVLAQLTREEGPSYTAKRMLELAGLGSS